MPRPAAHQPFCRRPPPAAPLCVQFISVLVAIVLRLCIYPRDSEYESYEDGGEGGARPSESQIQVGAGRRAGGVGCGGPAVAGTMQNGGTTLGR